MMHLASPEGEIETDFNVELPASAVLWSCLNNDANVVTMVKTGHDDPSPAPCLGLRPRRRNLRQYVYWQVRLTR